MTQEVRLVITGDASGITAAAAQAEAGVKRVAATAEVSARQTTAAMRQLPAQFTDIATQLAGGQNPLLILLQQGGQIKDSFGGAVPAVRALSSVLTPLRVVLGGVGAVAGVAAVAINQLEVEQARYSASIVSTNNAAGVSIGVLQDYARQVAAISGTVGGASAAIATLAGTGRVAGSDLVQAGTIAVRAQRLLGREVADTAKIYADLGRDPVGALLRLNEGTNFLTAATLRQVMALKSQGQEQAAAALAQQAFGEQQKRVLDDAERNLGTLERAWKSVTGAAKGAWDSMLNLGRPQSLQEQLAEVEKRLTTRTGSIYRESIFSRSTAPDEERARALRMTQLRQAEGAAADAARVAEEQDKLDALKSSRQSARIALDKALSDSQLTQSEIGLQKLRDLTQEAFDREEISARDHQQNLLAIDQAGLRARLANIQAQRAAEAGRATSDQAESENRQAQLAQLDSRAAEVRAQLQKLLEDERRGLRDITSANRSAPAQRLEDQRQFLQDMQDANARASIALIKDEQQRGEALIALDRQIAQRRIQAKNLTPERQQQATALADAAAGIERGALDRRLEGQTEFLQDMQDANRRAAIEMIRDERTRGEALIALDREIAQRRIEAKGLTPENKTQATSLADAASGIQRSQLEQRLGQGVYENVRDAITAALRDGQGNPVRSFAEALGRGVFAAVSKRLAESLATALVGREGTGGLFASLLGSLTGARAGGGPVMAGGMYLVGEQGPELLRMGAAGGYISTAPQTRAAMSGGPSISIGTGQVINIGQGVSRGEVFAAIQQANSQSEARIRRLSRNGDLG